MRKISLVAVVVLSLGVLVIKSEMAMSPANISPPETIRYGARLATFDPESFSDDTQFPKVKFPPPARPFPDPPASTISTRGPRPKGGADAMLWYWSDLNWPYGPSLPEEVLDAITLDNFLRLDELDYFPNKAVEQWQYVGDVGMDVRGSSWERYSGRITDIRLYHNDEVRISTPNGGLWQQVGAGWVHLTDDLPVLGIGSFDIHPTDTDTMIIGTGDHARGGGVGLYRTFDGGMNWEALDAIVGGQSFHVRYEPDSWGTNGVHAATRAGHFRSSSGGDLTTWTNPKVGWCTGLAFDPSTPGLMFAGFSSLDDVVDPGDPPEPWSGGLFRSTDFGVTWNKILDGSLPDSEFFSQVSLDVCQEQPNNVYALISHLSVTVVGGKNSINQKVHYLYRSVDKGLTWSSIAIPGSIDTKQGAYNHLLSVAPDNPNLVLIGGVKLYRTTDGGASWSGERDVHDDQHAAAWIPDRTNEVFVANDGGLYRSTDFGYNYDTDFNTLPITQYKEISVCVNDPDFIVGGAQDNGLSRTRDRINWEVFNKGDGGGIAISKLDCNDALAANGVSSGDLAFRRYGTDNAFNSNFFWNSGLDANDGWYPAVRWPGFLGTPFTATKNFVYRSPVGGHNWVKLNSVPFDDTILDMTVDALGATVYVTFATDVAGDRVKVFKNGTWNNGDLGGLPPNTRIRKVRPHPTRGVWGVAYAICTNSANMGTGERVFETSDFGATWTDLGASLGRVVPTDIIGHPTDPNQVYLATTLGMMWTPNSGTDWFNANSGAPGATFFSDLYVIPDPHGEVGDYWLYAGTYGNGIYRRRITAGVPGPPDPAKSFAIGAGTAHPDSSPVMILVHPDGSGQVPWDVGAEILVQVMDSNSVPVPGVAADRITLHPGNTSGSECGYFSVPAVKAEGPTDSAGWTSFRSNAFYWGGRAGSVSVQLDGVPLGGSPGLYAVSTDISNDVRVDILDLAIFSADYGGPASSFRSDFIDDDVIDDQDAAVLREAILAPKSCPFEMPALLEPDGHLGIYFDEAGTQFGRIVSRGDEFDLHIIARDLSEPIRGVEFKIPNLTHPGIEVLSVDWHKDVVSPEMTSGNEFMVVFDWSCEYSAEVPLATIRCRLISGTHVPFRMEPLAAPSFGIPTLPGVPGWINCEYPIERHQFAEFSSAAINPFPMALYWGLQHQVLGSAALVAGVNSVSIEGMDLVTGGGIHARFENVHVPGYKAQNGSEVGAGKGLPAGVDGAGFVFGTRLNNGNSQPDASIKLAMLDAGNTTMAQLEGHRVGGLWENTVSMPGIGAQVFRLELRNQGQPVLDDPAFDGTYSSEFFLPDVFSVTLINGEFHMGQQFGESFLVLVGGNQYQADEIEIRSLTQGSVGGGLLDSGFLEGSLLPDIQLLNVGVQRFGHFFSQAGNLVVVSESDALRGLLTEAAEPGTITINSLQGSPVDVNLFSPRHSENSATMEVQFSDGDDPKMMVGFANGPLVQVTADMNGVGANGWTARGYLNGFLQGEVSGGGQDVGDVSVWPRKVRMGQSGPVITWSSPVVAPGLLGANVEIDMLELVPLAPSSQLPTGIQMEVAFMGMAGVAFADDAALSPVPLVRRITTELHPNVPNPFNPSTEIRFSLAKPGQVGLKVYDLRGRLVRSLLDAHQPAGPGAVNWDGMDNRGVPAAAGVYHALLRTAEGDLSRKMVLVK